MQKWIEFNDLWLVIFDEQHKFWINQRSFFNKFDNVHFINMTATPIPRTLMLWKELWIQKVLYLTEFPTWEKKLKQN